MTKDSNVKDADEIERWDEEIVIPEGVEGVYIVTENGGTILPGSVSRPDPSVDASGPDPVENLRLEVEGTTVRWSKDE